MKSKSDCWPETLALLYDTSYSRVLSTLSTANQNSLISASDAAKKHCTGSSFNLSREKRSLRSTMQGERLSDTASTNARPELTFLISAILLQFFIAISYCVGISFLISPTHWRPRFSNDITRSTRLRHE